MQPSNFVAVDENGRVLVGRDDSGPDRLDGRARSGLPSPQFLEQAVAGYRAIRAHVAELAREVPYDELACDMVAGRLAVAALIECTPEIERPQYSRLNELALRVARIAAASPLPEAV